MIRCLHCTKQLFSMEDIRNVQPLGFSMWGECKHCGTRIPVSELWTKKKLYQITAGQLGKGVILT